MNQRETPNTTHSDTASGEDFASLLEQCGSPKALDLQVGTKVQAKIIHVGKDDVFCELSATQEASIPRTELVNDKGELTVGVGDRVDAFVVSLQGEIVLSRKLGRGAVDISTLEQAAHSQLPVEGLVSGANKGGLEIQIAGVRAFCPMGQVDIDFVEHPETFIGKTLQFVVREVKNGGRNVVLSRRVLLEAARAEQAKKTLAELEVGKRLSGRISRLTDFGAFVDLGGLDGLIPISEISHVRVKNPRDVLKEGETVTVEVLRIEEDPKNPNKRRIALSLKATLDDPMDQHLSDLAEGTSLPGKVTRLEKFGAFVEIFPGIEGLVHISQISDKRIRHPDDLLKIDQEVTVRILSVDRAERRISLSLREANSEAVTPQAEQKADGSTQGRRPDRKRRMSPEEQEERAIVDDFNRGQSPAKSLGTFGDLMKKAVATKKR